MRMKVKCILVIIVIITFLFPFVKAECDCGGTYCGGSTCYGITVESPHMQCICPLWNCCCPASSKPACSNAQCTASECNPGSSLCRWTCPSSATTTTTVSTIPNCYSLSGPSPLQVGQTGTYTANFYSPKAGDTTGRIGVDNFQIIVSEHTTENFA